MTHHSFNIVIVYDTACTWTFLPGTWDLTPGRTLAQTNGKAGVDGYLDSPADFA